MGLVDSFIRLTCLPLVCLGYFLVVIANVLTCFIKFKKIKVDKYLKGIIAHRCGTPENTLDGIRWCKQRGADVVEMDLRFTKDGIPVLYHDDDITKMTLEEANKSKER